MKTIPTKTTYLQMLSPPATTIVIPPGGVEVRRLESPSVEEYRALYRGVGAEYNWVDRLIMPDEDLRRIVQDERVEVHELTVAGSPAGYAELDRRTPGEIELAYFGLFPAFIGRGLGKFLLQRAVDIAWAHHPRRVWVHTCDLDHKAALGNYLKAGFAIYDERILQQPVPDDS